MSAANRKTRFGGQIDSVEFPVGPAELFLVNSRIPDEEKREVASCVMFTIGKLGDTLGSVKMEKENVVGIGWAIVYLNSLAKGLLDSMDLREGA